MCPRGESPPRSSITQSLSHYRKWLTWVTSGMAVHCWMGGGVQSRLRRHIQNISHPINTDGDVTQSVHPSVNAVWSAGPVGSLLKLREDRKQTCRYLSFVFLMSTVRATVFLLPLHLNEGAAITVVGTSMLSRQHTHNHVIHVMWDTTQIECQLAF